jgi:predicted metal-dependent phosphoesterase TrpH
MLYDLHAHTSASDGSFTPEELVDFAVQQGLGALAKCDHDTTDANARFLRHGEGKPIRLIAGVELSATWQNGNCHIVGLHVRDDCAPLEETLAAIRAGRGDRNGKIIAKLNQLGVDVTLEEAAALAGGDIIARPHIARVMVEKGYAQSVQEAFDRYLAKGAPAYLDRFRLDPERAVSLLVQAGARVVLAHPTQLKLDIDGVDELVGRLRPHGLAGIEVYTPYTPDELIGPYLDIAARHELIVTGGSDFHGASKPNHFLGYYREDVPIPQSVLDHFAPR